MKEKVNRKSDEKLYQPKIHSELIRKLHQIKEVTNLPMTVLVDHAIREYIEKERK